ncbi:serine/threonine-protein kinase LMTK3-like [Platysternon megacephalum]|uniref:Serine/threonine-protein kinase LMTK3-like n=1 Tax=Platysternon megacephalum TaxID=55544 RepID=A0A4D9DRV3_9SAUR|nr:serine/threonine-protein kinase LMTK3-like [Platysternon megacephalum]
MGALGGYTGGMGGTQAVSLTVGVGDTCVGRLFTHPASVSSAATTRETEPSISVERPCAEREPVWAGRLEFGQRPSARGVRIVGVRREAEAGTQCPGWAVPLGGQLWVGGAQGRGIAG